MSCKLNRQVVGRGLIYLLTYLLCFRPNVKHTPRASFAYCLYNVIRSLSLELQSKHVNEQISTEFVVWLLFWGQLLCCPAINRWYKSTSQQPLFVDKQKKQLKMTSVKLYIAAVVGISMRQSLLNGVFGCEWVFVLTV